MRLTLALPEGWVPAGAGRWSRGPLWCAVLEPIAAADSTEIARWAHAVAAADVPAGATARVLAEERWQTDAGWPFVLLYRECAGAGGCVEARYLAAYEMFDERCAAVVVAPDRQTLDREGVSALALLQGARPELPPCVSVLDWLEH